MKNYINILLALFFAAVTLFQAHAQIPSDSAMVKVAFGQTEKQDLTGGVAAVDVEELLQKNYYTYSLDGLQSLIGGYSGTVWGQWPLILVDGMPRDAANVLPSQIESITVLKAASAVVLYGSRAAKGAILITTKRGEAKPLAIDMRVNSGLYVPKSYPNYLDAASYMTLYNEACDNDHIARRYDESTIYNTAAGVNPYRYPDIEFFTDEYLRKTYNKTDLTGEVSGGNNNAKYYASFGMTYNNSLLKYGERKNDDYLKFNILTNVDLRITDWLKAFSSVGVIFQDSYTGRGDFWGQSASLRPNWYGTLLPIDQMDMYNSNIAALVENSNNIIDGKYLLGGNSTNTTSTFADMLVAGYIRDKYRDFMFQVALDADLSSFLKGLSFKTVFDIDYWDYYSEAYKNDYAVYEPTWSNVNGKDAIVGLTQFNLDKASTNEYIGSSSDFQTIMFSAQFDYKTQIDEVHNLAASLIGWGYQKQEAKDANHNGSQYHRTSNVNLGLGVQYNYARRYYADLGLNAVHSAKLPDGHRQALSPSLALGWRLDKEAFLADVAWLDNLKLTAAYTVLHQDLDIADYYMYKANYNMSSAWFQWKDAGQGGWFAGASGGGNDDLRMLQRKETRLGLEGSLLKGLLKWDLTLFTQDTEGGLTQGSSTIYPSFYSAAGYLPYINHNSDRRQGLDYSLYLNKRIGEVDATLGFAGLLYRSKALLRDETSEYAYLLTQGKSLNTLWGYVCEGFLTQADIDGGYTSTFGTVQAGDLKYADLNNDGLIDSKDQQDLGNSGTPFTYGLNLTLKWKALTLFAMGTGQTGGLGFKNSGYYWVKGSSKYSEVVWGRWTPETAATATYPRLTTTDNSNNFRNSTFWLYDTDRFNLTKVQLTCDLPGDWFDGKIVKGMSVYLNGESLLTIAKERKHLELNVGSAPQCRFFNLGATAKF